MAAIVAVLALIGAMVSVGEVAGAGSGPPSVVVRVDRSVPATVGQAIPVDVAVRDVTDLAAFEIVGTFSPVAAEVGAVETTHRGAAGAQDVSLGDLTGKVLLGRYTCANDTCGPAARAVRGASGTVPLGRILVTPKRAGVLHLRFGAARFTDSAGHALAVRGADTTVEIQVGRSRSVHPAPQLPWSAAPRAPQPPRLRDVNHDEAINAAELGEVAGVWQTRRLAGDPCRGNGSKVDVNGDGCVDALDLQFAATSIATQEPSAAAGATSADLRASAAPVAAPLSYTVTTTSDAGDSNVGNNVCAISGGGCSLRAAIQESNAGSGPQTINFAISGAGVQTIQLTRQLPSLNDLSGGTTIDGYSQPGSAVNTDPLASNAVIKIAIVGNGATDFDAFSVVSGNNTLRGLSIYDAHRPIWIHGPNADFTKIIGNFVGTDPSGTYTSPQIADAAHGINPEESASHTIIGTPALADRNVVSGNARHGIGFWHEQTDDNVVQNNIIGLDPTGTIDLGNRKHGVDLNFGVDHTLIGGTGPNERNVISGNDDTGVEVSHTTGTADNDIVGNLIGTTLAGDTSAPYTTNFDTGVYIEDGAQRITVRDNVIGNNGKGGVTIVSHGPTDGITGGVVVRDNLIGISNTGTAIPNGQRGVWVNGIDNVIGPNNVIANNTGPGITATEVDSLRNRFTRNTIYGNTGLGIDLSPNGVNANDPDDADSGPNDLLNFPVWTRATQNVFEGSACANCTIEVFVADGPFTNGSGRTFVTSGVAGPSGSFSIPNNVQPIGTKVTATAIQPDGTTSEFAPNVTIALHNDPPVIDAGADVAVAEGGSVVLGASANDPDGQPVTYTWDLDDDGTFETSGQMVDFSAAGLDGPSTVTVAARATDSGGLSGTDTLVVSINNAVPTAVLTTPASGPEASQVVVQMGFGTDPSPLDVSAGLHFAFSCSGSSLSGESYASAGTTPSTTCTLPDGPASATIRAAVIDKDGGLSEYLGAVSVSNVAPTVSVIGVPTTMNEGGTAPLTDDVSDPSPADVNAGFTRAWTATAPGRPTLQASSSTWDFSPPDDGQYTVGLVVTDQDGGTGSASHLTTVNNVAPTALLQTTLDGATATVTMASPTDPSTADVVAGLHFAFACNGASLAGTTYASATTVSSIQCVYGDGEPQHLVRARILDKDGGSTEYSTVVTAAGNAPVIGVSPSFDVHEGGSVQVDATATDADGGVLTYDWDLDANGTFETPGQQVVFAAGALDGPAQYPVSVRVTDPTGLASTGQSLVSVTNVAPTGTLPPVQAAEGVETAVTVGDPSDPSAADAGALHFAFSCTGDSLSAATYASAQTSPTANCVYWDGPSSGTVRARVIDKDGAFTEYTASVTVTNTAPVITVTAPPTANEGTTVNFSATAVDPSEVDQAAGLGIAWTVQRNGSPFASGGGVLGSFAASDDGSYEISVTATDKDGGEATSSSTVLVANLAPTATLVAPSSIAEGGSATVALTGADDASAVDTQSLRFAFSCSGAALTGMTYATADPASSTTCVFGAASVTVRAAVYDKDGGVTEYTRSVSVNNVAPTAKFVVPPDVVAGEPVTLQATDVRDESGAANVVFAFDCGAGFGAPSASPSVVCPPLPTGGSIVRMRAIDQGGAQNEYSARVVGHPNSLTNPSFEADANNDQKPDGWTWPNAATRAADSVHWGSFAGKVTGTKGPSIKQPAVPVVRGRYVANAWLNIPASAGTTSVKWSVRWYNAGGTQIKTTSSPARTTSTQGWAQLTYTPVVPEGSLTASAELVISTTNATLWFDDLSFNMSNQIQNPGMELDANNDTRPDTWASLSRWVRSTTEVYSDTYSAVALADGSTINPSQKVKFIVPGSTYHASVWINVPTPEPANFKYSLRIRWLDSLGVAISTPVLVSVTTTTPGWVQLQGSVVAPAGADSARLELPMVAPTQNVYADAAFFGTA